MIILKLVAIWFLINVLFVVWMTPAQPPARSDAKVRGRS